MKILIPIDFTQTTSNALEYGLRLAKSRNCEIALIHIVSELTHSIQLTKDMHQMLRGYTEYDTSKISCIVKKGSIFETIQSVAEEINATLILLGTHETSTLTKMLGTKAIKVISNSKIPIITLKENTDFKPIKRILITLDLAKESTQVARHITDICLLFNAEVFIVGGEHSDTSLKQRSKINSAIVMSHFEHNNIIAHVVLLPRKKFLNHLVNFCTVHEIDLIAATYYVDKISPFTISFVQSLLDNSQQIPVFTIDSQSISKSGALSFLTI